MLNLIFRFIVIGFFGLLGFTNLLVLHGVTIDLIHRRQFGHFSVWSQRTLDAFLHQYRSHHSIFEDLMPTILSIILIMIFYLSGNLLMTDILVAILIFDDAQLIRDHIEKRPPLSVRAALAAKVHPGRSAHESRVFLADVALQTVVSLVFTILPYIYVLITK